VSAKQPAIAIVGAGGLARAMARALSRSGGAAVTVASRRPAAAKALARGAPGVRAVARIEDAIAGAAIVLLAVPDRAIAPLALALVPVLPSWRGIVVLHAAGAYGPELLAALGARGAATGVLHPLAVLGAGSGTPLSGAAARIEGQAAARAAARRLCALTGLIPLRGSGLQSPQGRCSYHAAASLASNDLVALLAAAHGLLVRRGVPGRDALRALTGLAEGALGQVRRVGLLGALTGPVVRNDGGTLLDQLRALAAEDPAAAAAHRALSLRLTDLAEAGGRLNKDASRAIRLLLARGPGRRPTV
jgi:predicted short-subunit dehydrogenase-like oxidoreductase (DUF2520 family)